MVTLWWLISVGAILLNFKTTYADGHVNIQVQVLSYDNPLGTSYHGSDFTSQRKCCDNGRNISACSTTDACDSYFIFCIGGVNHGHCIGPHSTSRILSDSNSFTTSYDNSIIYSFVWDHWNSGIMNLTFNVMDKDGRGHELIDNFTSTTALRVDSNYEESASQILSLTNFVSLDIGIRIWCQDGYTGSDCSRQCTNKPYRTCSKNHRSVLLPSCKDTGVLRLSRISGSSLPLDFTPLHLQQLLFNFILHEICPEADRVNVTILHFSLKGATEFKAMCNNTEVSKLLFTTHIYILSLTDKTSMSRYFPNIQFKQPAVQQKNLEEAHFLMMANVVEYQDTSSDCIDHACSVEISICLQRTNAGCERTLTMQSTMHGKSLVICGGQLVDSSTATKEQYVIGLSAFPVLNIDVKYNSIMKWQVKNHNIQSYTVETTYNEAKLQKMSFSSNHGQTLVLEFMLWCAAGWSGNNCQHSCHSTSNKECNADGHLVCRKGYHLGSCVDINECSHNPCKNGGSCHNTPGSFTCKCSTGWTGPTCEMDVDECDLGYCQNATSCTNNFGSFHCTCMRGFRGKTCKDNNECKAPITLCKHGGLCLNNYGSVSCLCAEGFTGRKCDDDIDECAQSICYKDNTVSCGNSFGDYNCNCKKGWTGKTCETDIDECLSKPCFKGTCNNFRGNYTCSCYSGYTGRNCENDQNECLVVDCANNGTCVNLPYPKRYRCDCLEGWDPISRCLHSTDPCRTITPCIHGHCTTKYGNYICNCDDGWNGHNCSNDIDECKSSPCKNNGSCRNTQGSYTCSCLPAWTGLKCETDIDECKSWPCKNNGSCSNTLGSYSCSCPNGWTGLKCGTDVDECKSSPCKNNGSCNNTQGSYACSCPLEWTGLNCNNDIDECKSSPCKNNGSCSNTQGSYTCSCPSEWTGLNCLTDVDECKSSPCVNNGTCSNTLGSYSCLCLSEWTGLKCKTDINECKSWPCKNNGSCSNTLGSYSCSCRNEWTGLKCENDVDECKSSPCINNGTCINIQGSYSCSCPNGWTGLNCGTDNDECESLPCKNNGSCKNTKGGFSCICLQNSTGSHCETDVNKCDQEPCKNNGTCINFRGSFQCSCTTGWESKNCEVDINECNGVVTPCDETSICVNTNGSYECIYDSSMLSIPVTKHLTVTKTTERTLQYYDSVTTESQRKADNLTTYLSTYNKLTITKNEMLSTVSPSERKPVSPTEANGLFSGTETADRTYSTASQPRSDHLSSAQTQMFPKSTLKALTVSSSKATNARASLSTPPTYLDTKSTNFDITAASKMSATTQASTTLATNYDKLEEAIYPRCTNSGWNVTLNISMLKEIYPAISSNHIYFGDSSCLGRLKGDLLIFQQGFRECLTSERISGTTILYENDLYYAIYDPINPFIIRQHKWTYTVECDVNRNEAASSHVHHDIDAHHTAVSGHYNISMMFFKDPGYMQQISGNPIHVSVGDQVYVKVVTSASDWSIKMRMHTCYTKPTEAADNMIFYIIKDGCEVDSNTHIISQSTHETRFVFQDFEYSTNREGLNIYCNATFCETQDYSPGCAQSCVMPGSP